MQIFDTMNIYTDVHMAFSIQPVISLISSSISYIV